MMLIRKFFLYSAFGIVLAACSSQYRYEDSQVVEEQYVHQYGIEVEPNDWVQRGQNGAVITTLKNGVVVSKNFSQGVLHGDVSYSYPYSQETERQETYHNGSLVKETKYDLTGSPKSEVEYLEDQRKQTTLWYETGHPQSRESHYSNRLEQGDYYTKDNQLESQIFQGTGTKIIRDQQGDLQAKEYYLNGELVMRSTFYPSGSPKEQTKFQNGIANGTRKTFLPDGEPDVVEEWRAGAKTGLTTLFKNGEKSAEIPYQNGLKNGLEKRYKNGTVVVQEIWWKNDVQHGPSYNYIGDKTLVDWFFNGRPVSKGQFDLLSSPNAPRTT